TAMAGTVLSDLEPVRPKRSAAAVGRLHRAAVEAAADLRLDAGNLVVFGIESQRVRPLEPRLVAPADLPVGIAEMLVDRRVAGLQGHRALQLAHGLLVAAGHIEGPAEAVRDEPVLRPQLHRAPDQLLRLGQIVAAVDPGITQI